MDSKLGRGVFGELFFALELEAAYRHIIGINSLDESPPKIDDDCMRAASHAYWLLSGYHWRVLIDNSRGRTMF